MKKKTIEDYASSNIKPSKLMLHRGDEVFNAEDTVNDEPIVGDGVWIEYWEVASGKAIPDNCPCCNDVLDRTVEGNIHGTHIQLEKRKDSQMYIIPTCNSCNGKHGEELKIEYVDEILAVEAIKKQ